MDIRSLKNFQVHGNDVDELIAVEADLKTLAQTYAGRNLEIPEWVNEKLGAIDIEIKTLVRAERQAKIKKMKAQRSALMTPDEKRQRLDAEIAEEEALL